VFRKHNALASILNACTRPSAGDWSTGKITSLIMVRRLLCAGYRKLNMPFSP
jgi:hypothetical protein